jgi:hypothetical protein
VEVARKRIDLVIEGDDGLRLAVECDGEAWHGPEQYAHDTFRQRQLERAGWRFVRVRESLFYADEEKAISEVIAACEELEIVPGRRRAKTPPAEEPAHATESQDTKQGYESDSHSSVLENEELINPQRESSDSISPSDISKDERAGPFTGYGTKHYPDPRTAPIANVREAVLDIVTGDGPLPKASIYRLYRDGCPRVERAGKNLRQAVNKAVYALERTGLITSRDEGRRRDPSEVVVKLLSQPWVENRPAGSRGIEDVPLSELASTLHAGSHGRQRESGNDRLSLYREVAQKYNVRRLMPNVVERLEMAERITPSEDQQAGAESRLF